MVVHRSPTVGDDVVKPSLRVNDALGLNVIAHIAAALALAGHESHPIQRVLCDLVTMVAVVLQVVPYSVGDLEQLVVQLLGIMDAVVLAAEFYPPIAGAPVPVPILSPGEIVTAALEVSASGV